MSRSKIGVVAIIWALSLVGTGVWAQMAESRNTQGREVQPGDPVGEVITSPDIGFQRVSNPGERNGTITGRWMVRVNGEWLIATAPMSIRPVGAN